MHWHHSDTLVLVFLMAIVVSAWTTLIILGALNEAGGPAILFLVGVTVLTAFLLRDAFKELGLWMRRRKVAAVREP